MRLESWFDDSRSAAYVSIRQHTSAYVSIRQHTPAYERGLVRREPQRWEDAEIKALLGSITVLAIQVYEGTSY